MRSLFIRLQKITMVNVFLRQLLNHVHQKRFVLLGLVVAAPVTAADARADIFPQVVRQAFFHVPDHVGHEQAPFVQTIGHDFLQCTLWRNARSVFVRDHLRMNDLLTQCAQFGTAMLWLLVLLL